MRILLVTPLFFPSLSGAAVYFDTLARGLRGQEPAAEITILTRRLRGAPAGERRDGARVLRLLPDSRLAAPAVLAAAAALRSDVVHYHTIVSYRGLHRLAPLFRAPLVGDMRDLAARNEGADLRHYLHCSRVICASENIVRFLSARGFPAAKLAHVPIPFEPPVPPPPALVAAARARYGIPGHRPYALFVGVIIPYKGVRELLAAMERVWRERPELGLVLAGPLTREGDAAFPGGFRAAVAGDPRLHYLGPVPHAEIPLLLAGAELFILPSRTEGLPRSCLEAIALGRKVVLPPGIPEFDAAGP
ncbi:MAG: glycosyltransferase family 4 protein, partial [Candidatus Rokubacteria bacterium]|nr:glycosyltransferase family 4 protein [Candidatus Rokubacteria bacterium]